eukprot:5316135-Amphidinium_carterae.1
MSAFPPLRWLISSEDLIGYSSHRVSRSEKKRSFFVIVPRLQHVICGISSKNRPSNISFWQGYPSTMISLQITECRPENGPRN